MSSLSAIKPNLLVLCFFIYCSVSKATKMLSEISLFLVKVNWCFVMIAGSIFFNLFARTLEKNLVKDITKTYGSNLMNIFRTCYFWN